MDQLRSSLLAAAYAGIWQSSLDSNSHRWLKVAHDLARPECRDLIHEPTEDFGVQRKLPAGHHNGEDANDGAFILTKDVEDL